MSNHFTGLKLGPPLGDQRLDLTDLYAFQAPADPTRTVLILNCNTFAQAADFHPDAVYRINIDNDGDAETDVALSFVFVKYLGLGLNGIIYGTITAVVGRCVIWQPWYVMRTLRRESARAELDPTLTVAAAVETPL